MELMTSWKIFKSNKMGHKPGHSKFIKLHTPFRPIKSVILPHVMEAIVAPTVTNDPNMEYCNL